MKTDLTLDIFDWMLDNFLGSYTALTGSMRDIIANSKKKDELLKRIVSRLGAVDENAHTIYTNVVAYLVQNGATIRPEDAEQAAFEVMVAGLDKIVAPLEFVLSEICTKEEIDSMLHPIIEETLKKIKEFQAEEEEIMNMERPSDLN